MKILEIFTEKLRYKNYSPRTIDVYKSYLKTFLQLSNQLLNKVNLPI
jgi:hypothetical protein